MASDPDSRQLLTGTALVLLGAFGFSSKSILIKLAYADDAAIDPITLMALRMLLALPFFLLAAWWQRQARPHPPRAGDWLGLMVLGMMGYYLASLLDFTGLQYLSAGLERLILFLYPTLVVLLNALLRRRPVSRPQRWALIFSYLGIVLVVGFNPQPPSAGLLRGALLVFSSALVFALFLIGSERLIPRFGAGRYTAYSMAVACLATGLHFGLSHPLERLLVSPKVLGLGLLLALFATVAPAFLMNAGIQRIGAGHAAIISSIGPIATLALAYALLDETLTLPQLSGAVLVLGGVLMVSRAKPRA